MSESERCQRLDIQKIQIERCKSYVDPEEVPSDLTP